MSGVMIRERLFTVNKSVGPVFDTLTNNKKKTRGSPDP